MKKLAFILSCVCALVCFGNSLPIQEQAAFFVQPQPVASGGGGGGSFTYTFITNINVSASANSSGTSSAIDCRDANLAILSIIHLGGTVKTANIVGAAGLDKNNNTYQAGTTYHNAGNNTFAVQYYCTNGTFDSAMTWNVEVDAPGTGYPTMMVSLYKKSVGGVAATPLFDQATGTNGAVATTASWTIPQLTPSTDGELSVCAGILGNVFNQTTTSLSDGSQVFTKLINASGNSGGWLIQTTATPVGPTVVYSASGTQFAGANILFK